MYRRAYAVNHLAKAHHVSPQGERVIELLVEDVRYTPSGRSKTRSALVQSDFTGTPPDNPKSAYQGLIQPIPQLENGDVAVDNRAIAEFYGCEFGDYRIGMNCTAGKSFVFSPPGFTSGVDLVSGKTLTAPITVGPQTTVILHVGTGSGLRNPYVTHPRSGFEILPMRNTATLTLRLLGPPQPGAMVRLFSPQGRSLLEREFTGAVLTLSLDGLGRKTLFGEVRGMGGTGGYFRVDP